MFLLATEVHLAMFFLSLCLSVFFLHISVVTIKQMSWEEGHYVKKGGSLFIFFRRAFLFIISSVLTYCGVSWVSFRFFYGIVWEIEIGSCSYS